MLIKIRKRIQDWFSERLSWNRHEIFGAVILLTAFFFLLFYPDALSGLFQSVIDHVKPVVVDVFLTGDVGVAILSSVIIGRSLERVGLTDALIRIFVPYMKLIDVNPAVIIPSIYNILGDINAAGKIAGPILCRAETTKTEQKIAVATMVQSQQSFSTLMLGLIAMTAAGVNSFPIIIIAVFLPMILVPTLLSKTIYRDTRHVTLSALPKFTPETGYLPTLFNAAKEGAELLFLLIIPAAAAIFVIIGVCDYIGIWTPFHDVLRTVLTYLSVDPKSGTDTFLVSPTLGMGVLSDTAASLDPRMVVGSFVLAASGLPLATVFGQIPAIWAVSSDLAEKEIIEAAFLGIVMRIGTAFVIGAFLTPFVT